jgi:hypothetical protein
LTYINCICFILSFDAENDLEAAQGLLSTMERSAFKDKVLDNLKETPMTMKERLNIRE